jgi:hypothetical protein
VAQTRRTEAKSGENTAETGLREKNQSTGAVENTWEKALTEKTYPQFRA